MFYDAQVKIDAKETLKYQQGEDSYTQFSSEYNKIYSREWIGRKILAIPKCISGIVQAIVHLALAIICGMATLAFGREFYKIQAFKNIYCCGRDLEESAGSILTLFNDKLGLYLIERAAYQKQCYRSFDPAPASVGKYSALVQNKLQQMTLLEYKGLVPLEKRSYFAAYYGPSLGRSLWILESTGVNIERFFKETSDEKLSKYTLEDLIFHKQTDLVFEHEPYVFQA